MTNTPEQQLETMRTQLEEWRDHLDRRIKFGDSNPNTYRPHRTRYVTGWGTYVAS